MYIKNLVERELFPESFPVRIDHNTDDFQYPAHWHKATEIAFAAKSDSSIIINNRHYTLREGDLVYIAGGDIHSYPLTKGCERVFLLFDLMDLEQSGLWSEEYTRLSKSVFIKKDSSETFHSKVMEHMKGILSEAAEIKPGSKLVLLARIYDLLALIVRNTNTREALEGSVKKELLHKIGQVVEFVEENYMEPIPLKAAADIVGFSEHYLSRIFNQAIGVPYHLYLNKIRIKHAGIRIILNEENISEIAFNCGFNSIPTFNRVFRNVMGCTPLQYRKMRRDHMIQKEGGSLDEK